MTPFTRRLPWPAAAILVLAAGACGGGGSSAPETPAPPAVTTNPVDPATAGSVKGVVRFDGTATKPEPIDMASDPYCMRQGGAATETVAVANDGALQNVFVYVKDGLGALRFPVPTSPVVLDQQGCTYRPHVFGIQVGQPLEILNSDETLHNVHALPTTNREFNRGQAQKGMTHTHVFTTAEVMVPFKCDVHKWMKAFVGVVDHPFHAVTAAGGTFALTGLPPGTYTVEAVHETLGAQTQTVTIAPSQSQTISFIFKG